jgi:TolA-binding protein
MKIINFIILSLLCSILASMLLKAEEVSVFAAGNLADVSPYGLDETEKQILTNKQRLGVIETKQENLGVKMSGLMSVIEGSNTRNNNIGLEIKQISKDVVSLTLLLEQVKQQAKKNQQQITKLSKNIKTFTQTQNSNIQRLKEAIRKINLSLKAQNKNKAQNKKTKQKPAIINKKNSFKLAVKKFNINHLTSAKSMFKNLIGLNYKVAECNYYLGEISFLKKKYSVAISYYKKSMKNFKGKKYVPSLLLHSGISFEHLNDKTNAIKFYETLIDNYVSSKEAMIASDNLLKLQNN